MAVPELGQTCSLTLFSRNTGSDENFLLVFACGHNRATRLFRGLNRKSHAQSMFSYLALRDPIAKSDLERTGFRFE
jgi:hypothetical protein